MFFRSGSEIGSTWNRTWPNPIATLAPYTQAFTKTMKNVTSLKKEKKAILLLMLIMLQLWKSWLSLSRSFIMHHYCDYWKISKHIKSVDPTTSVQQKKTLDSTPPVLVLLLANFLWLEFLWEGEKNVLGLGMVSIHSLGFSLDIIRVMSSGIREYAWEDS